MSLLLFTVKTGLAKSTFFSTLPANVLTIPLAILADYTFSCPCDSENNTHLTGLVLFILLDGDYAWAAPLTLMIYKLYL